MSAYVKIAENQVPLKDIRRWDTPARYQGQTEERQFAAFGRGESGEGAPYMRVLDRSTGPGAYTYYRWAED